MFIGAGRGEFVEFEADEGGAGREGRREEGRDGREGGMERD